MMNGIYSSTGEAWASGRPPRGIPAVLLSLPKWGRTTLIGGLALVAALQWSTAAFAVEIAGAKHALILGIPIEFVLFGLTLLGVALFHHHTLAVSLTGLAVVVVYKLTIAGFKFGTGFSGLAGHMQHEWVTLANLFLLLMGFAVLSRHFEKSSNSRRNARPSTQRLEGRLSIADHHIRAVWLSR